ncbi:MAG: hypothetical protein IKE92_13105 [Clostridiales bacterium]|nr:hypothetical protein [Clostridiales bacterium]
MKKLISVIIISAMMLSLAACDSDNGKDSSGSHGRNTKNTQAYKPEGPDPIFIDETTVQTTEATETSAAATTETTTEATTTTTAFSFGKVTDYVVDARSDYQYLEIYGEYHVPRLLFDSSYAAEMQKEIEKCFSVYITELEEYGNTHYYSTDYAAFLTDEGILSIVFVENGEWGDDLYHVWNFDVATGNKVSNSTIAEITGVRDIRKTAMDAAQAYLNNNGMMVVENYELVSPDDDYYVKAVEDTFSEERLNDNMMMGLQSDGTVFFVSGIASIAGGEWYYRMYDAKGNDLTYASGWVR